MAFERINLALFNAFLSYRDLFQVLIGFILLAFLVVCGRKCNYIASHLDLFNPVNLIFVRFQKLFLLDYIFIIYLIFLATLIGIIKI
ncbi:MAG: hypothetical protein EXX96DRAFT_91222 [Benjaminiella poitrasii]|nr:MAG: hypothetical protein EXX96DRAFT_91222 [Benjaminiella poitrasii]